MRQKSKEAPGIIRLLIHKMRDALGAFRPGALELHLLKVFMVPGTTKTLDRDSGWFREPVNIVPSFSTSCPKQKISQSNL